MTTSKEYCDVICDAIDTYGREAQTDMCIEECSELIKALLKLRRLPLEERIAAKGMKALENIQEEIADVQIMLWQIDLMYGYGYVEDQIDKKLNRLKERIRADGKPKEEESGIE
jgi:NTP pyrophosphatase (non-canonical NTP hydrolase)